MAKTVAVLFGEGDRPENYVVSALADYWREDGIEVRYLFGTREAPPADLLIVHVDLSVLPPDYRKFAQRYARVLNGRARDIRKHTFSRLLVSRDSAFAGPVMVKTDLNCGGDPEVRHLRHQVHQAPPLLRLWPRYRLARLRSAPGDWASAAYTVYPSPGAVPAAVWDNPFFVVEKFVPERIDGRYAVRTYHFLGESESFYLLLSDQPVVKGTAGVEARPFDPDPRLRVLRRAMGFDYGKFDYVLHEGEPVLLDINKTVGLNGRFMHDPEIEKARHARARGILDFLS
jgi:hypothetical protein